MILMEKVRYLRVWELMFWCGNRPYSQSVGERFEGLKLRETLGGIHVIEKAPLWITGAGEWSGVAREGDQFWQENNFF